jgi:hypothetical protein
MGILCLSLSGLVFGLSLLSDAKADSYYSNNTVAVLTKRGIESIVPLSPLFINCKSMSSRFFAVGSVALGAGMLLIERSRLLRRMDALENEVVAMRSCVVRK